MMVARFRAPAGRPFGFPLVPFTNGRPRFRCFVAVFSVGCLDSTISRFSAESTPAVFVICKRPHLAVTEKLPNRKCADTRVGVRTFALLLSRCEEERRFLRSQVEMRSILPRCRPHFPIAVTMGFQSRPASRSSTAFFQFGNFLPTVQTRPSRVTTT